MDSIQGRELASECMEPVAGQRVAKPYSWTGSSRWTVSPSVMLGTDGLREPKCWPESMCEGYQV